MLYFIFFIFIDKKFFKNVLASRIKFFIIEREGENIIYNTEGMFSYRMLKLEFFLFVSCAEKFFYFFNPGRLLFVLSTKLIYSLSYNSFMFDQISVFSSTALFDNKSLQSVGCKNFFVRRFDEDHLTVQEWPSSIKKMSDPGTFTHYKVS